MQKGSQNLLARLPVPPIVPSLLAVGICALFFRAPIAAAAPPQQPKTAGSKVAWSKVDATVKAYFAAIPGQQARDIISRNQVAPLLTKLGTLGWKVPEPEKLLAKIPADSSWLVANLRTPNGKKFMRQISGFPQGYDRTDRLSSLSDGRQIVAALIQGPGGYEMIQFLTTSRTGKNTSKELTAVPGGADFNKPTGKLYTVDALLGELSRLYEEPKTTPPSKRPAAKRTRPGY